MQDLVNPMSINFNTTLTEGMFGIKELHDYVMAYLVFIFFLTTYMLYISCFSAYKWVPEGSKEFLDNELYLFWYTYKRDKNLFKHSGNLEFLWILVPSLILLKIASPSLVLLYFLDFPGEPVYNITVIGNQWYWTYEYNDFDLRSIFSKIVRQDGFFNNLDKNILELNNLLKTARWKEFEVIKEDVLKFYYENEVNSIFSQLPTRISVDSNMVITQDLSQPRLLTTDQVLVLPSNTPVRLLITANDVIHSWAVPNFGIKVDAVPGRINQVVLETYVLGSVWGQCSELCGVNHGFMPIEIRVLSLPDFLFYIETKVTEMLHEHLVKYLKLKSGMFNLLSGNFFKSQCFYINIGKLIKS
jgi:heme/copper-type cytochrome/quinol oxidase subunit 2